MLCLEQLRDSPPPNLKSLVILDARLAERLGLKESEIRVFGNHTLADLSADLARLLADPGRLNRERTSLGRIIFTDPFEWCLAEDLFTEKLALVPQGNAFPGAQTIPGEKEVATACKGTPILPLRRRLLSYLHGRYLTDPDPAHCRLWYVVKDHGVEVHLILPLTGDPGAPRSLHVQRFYSTEQLTKLDVLPVLEVWPNFRSPDWSCYYTFWDGSGGGAMFRAVPIPEAKVSAGQPPPGSAPLAQGPAQLAPAWNFQGSSNFAEGSAREVWHLDTAPEFFACSQGDRELGVLVVRYDREIGQIGSAGVRIGVDFGTTNTHVYLHLDNEPSERPLTLKVASHRITEAPEGVRSGKLYGYFLPTMESAAGAKERSAEEAPFLSFLRKRPECPDDLDHRGNPRAIPIEHAHIFFFNERYGLRELLKLLNENVYSDLKWSDKNRHLIELYLRQLCLHATAEAFCDGAGEVAWRYSYPLAFSAVMTMGLHGIWQRLGPFVQSACPKLQCAASMSTSESAATAHYFREFQQALVPGGAVVIDIGGGTSDLSVWQYDQPATNGPAQNDRPKWQTSVRLAGRELLLRPFFELRGKLDSTLDAEDRIYLPEPKPGTRPERFYARLDALLRTRGEKLRTAVANHNAAKDLVRLLGFGICGLFYYAGQTLCYLVERGEYDKQRRPEILVGGNGSKLLDWLYAGHYGGKSQVNGLLSDMIVKSAKLGNGTNFVRIIRSQMPKAETAMALVTDNITLTLGQVPAPQGVVVAGEIFSIRNPAAGEDPKLVTRNQLAKGRVGFETPQILKEFVSSYNDSLANRNIPASPVEVTDWAAIADNIRSWLAAQGHLGADEIGVEPLFVIGLRVLLDQLCGKLGS